MDAVSCQAEFDIESMPTRSQQTPNNNIYTNKARFLIENPRNQGNIAYVGSRGGRGIFILHIKKRIAPKLCRIILLHFGLVTFRIHFRKTRKTYMFMVFGPSGRDH